MRQYHAPLPHKWTTNNRYPISSLCRKLCKALTSLEDVCSTLAKVGRFETGAGDVFEEELAARGEGDVRSTRQEVARRRRTTATSTSGTGVIVLTEDGTAPLCKFYHDIAGIAQICLKTHHRLGLRSSYYI